ncbi:hypothetical protein CBL_05105 [Carabus blaptoides fortunei]
MHFRLDTTWRWGRFGLISGREVSSRQSGRSRGPLLRGGWIWPPGHVTERKYALLDSSTSRHEENPSCPGCPKKNAKLPLTGNFQLEVKLCICPENQQKKNVNSNNALRVPSRKVDNRPTHYSRFT